MLTQTFFTLTYFIESHVAVGDKWKWQMVMIAIQKWLLFCATCIYDYM